MSLNGFDPWPPDSAVHVEWGVAGTRQATARGDAIVIVDVLRFSTTIVTAVEQGAVAMVYSPGEIDEMGGSATVSRSANAIVVAQKNEAAPARYSLSPLTMRSLPKGERIVFSSANGALAVAAADGASHVIVGSLRNRAAVASHVSSLLAANASRRVTMIACGEQWSTLSRDHGLRPAVEDLLGVGAIASLLQQNRLSLSSEALAAAAVYSQLESQVREILLSSISGRELIFKGLREDVLFAAEVDKSVVVPTLTERDGHREFQAG